MFADELIQIEVLGAGEFDMDFSPVGDRNINL